jgi:hypothetical protein
MRYSKRGYAVAPNLLKNMEVTGSRQVVVSDITYVRLGASGFAYLFLLTDQCVIVSQFLHNL